MKHPFSAWLCLLILPSAAAAGSLEIVEDGTFLAIGAAPPALAARAAEADGVLTSRIAPPPLHAAPVAAPGAFSAKVAPPPARAGTAPAAVVPPPVPSAVVANALDACKTIRFPDITFPVGKATLTADGLAFVAAVAEALVQSPGLRIAVAGHTDDTGSRTSNQVLSEARAGAVRGALVGRHGIVAARIRSRGFGEDAPVASNASDAGRAANRRVEIRNDACGG